VARKLVTLQVHMFVIVNEQIPKDITEKVELRESQGICKCLMLSHCSKTKD